MNPFVFLLLFSYFLIKFFDLLLLFLESWTLSYWGLLCTNVNRNVIKGLHVGRLERSVAIVKLFMFSHTWHWLSKPFSIFNGLVSLCSLIPYLYAPSYFGFDISIIVGGLLSNFSLIFCLQLDHFDRLGNDGCLLKVFDVFICYAWSVFKFINCFDVLKLWMLLKFSSLCRIYK